MGTRHTEIRSLRLVTPSPRLVCWLCTRIAPSTNAPLAPPRSLPPPAGPLAAAPLPPTAAAHAPRTLQPRDFNAPGYEMYYIKICYEPSDELLYTKA